MTLRERDEQNFNEVNFRLIFCHSPANIAELSNLGAHITTGNEQFVSVLKSTTGFLDMILATKIRS